MEEDRGNAGKSEMLLPFGFDKSIDRVKGNHRRPVREITDSQAQNKPVKELTIEVISTLDPYVDYLLRLIKNAEANGQMYFSGVTYADYLRGFLDSYIQKNMPSYIERGL